MSVEEDTELRDLISQTLEANGCFAKIRAQLRASIYLALDEEDAFQKKGSLINKKLQSALETAEGRVMFCIVREFLEHFNLEFTISVFEPESYMGSNYEYLGPYKLMEELNIPNLETESPDPVLLQLIQLCKVGNKSLDLRNTENSISSLNYKSGLSNQDINNDNSTTGINGSYNADHILVRSICDNSISENPLNKTFNIKKKDVSESRNISFIENKIEDNCDNSVSQSEQSFKEKSLIDFDKSVQIESTISRNDSEKSKSLIDQSIVDTDFSPPIVKDGKHSKFDTSFDKLKLPSSKSDKIKVKNNLSSLSDLPPLQMSKTRSNDMLLPSLYTKEFKDKCNVKDVDKMFELEPLDNYEEDFISESEIDLTMSRQDEVSKSNIVGEMQFKKNQNVTEGATNKNCDSFIKETNFGDKKAFNVENNSTASSVTSEDFELHSNIDDILNSC